MLRSIGLRKKPASIVTMVAIVTLAVMLNVGNVHAQTLILTPNPVTQGMNVQVTGSGFQEYENAEIQVYASNSGTCGAMPVVTLDASTDSSGNLNSVTIQTSGLSAGTYCVEGNGFLIPPDTVDLIINPATTATTAGAPTTSGYIYLLLLPVFVVLVYVVIKTRQALNTP